MKVCLSRLQSFLAIPALCMLRAAAQKLTPRPLTPPAAACCYPHFPSKHLYGRAETACPTCLACDGMLDLCVLSRNANWGLAIDRRCCINTVLILEEMARSPCCFVPCWNTSGAFSVPTPAITNAPPSARCSAFCVTYSTTEQALCRFEPYDRLNFSQDCNSGWCWGYGPLCRANSIYYPIIYT